MDADARGDLDRLYALPLGEFVTARNELAKRLRQAGDREAAEEVRGLRKPTLAAWAVNLLARERRDDVEAFLAAGDRLREAMAGGDPDEFRAATEAERELLDRLVEAARSLLPAYGQAASEATLERVAATLQGLAGDPGERARLGRLTRELDPAGFGALAGLAAAPRGKRVRARPPDELAARRVTKAREAVAEAAEEARARADEAEEAEREAAEARNEAERAEKQAVRARERAERAEERCKRLEDELRRAEERAAR